MLRIVEFQPLPGYRLHLRYNDGVEGDVDLSSFVGKGVFRLWNDPKAFENVSIGSGGEVRWSDEIDMCANSLYLKITGTPPGEVLPSIEKAPIRV